MDQLLKFVGFCVKDKHSIKEHDFSAECAILELAKEDSVA